MTKNKRCALVTGANGFVGRATVSQLNATEDFAVRATVRRPEKDFPPSVEVVSGLDLTEDAAWAAALAGVDVVIHCAARVHVMNEHSADPLADFRKANTEATLNIALQAAAAGVQRFIFLSTLGVNGAETFGRAYTAADIAKPHSPYAQSKFEAEQALLDISRSTGMSVTIIRPPLVYGPSAPGNFGALLRWVKRGLPLPLGAVSNRRSFVFLDNLVDLVVRCVGHPSAANQVFMVSDDEDLSTTQLLRKMGQAVGKRTVLFPVPVFMLNLAARVIGKRKMATQLLGSLQVDIEKTKSLLGWTPPFTVDAALQKTAGRR